MLDPDHEEVEKIREEFFRRTRITALALYAGLGIGGAALGGFAVANDPRGGSVGVVVGGCIAIVLCSSGRRVPVSARASRLLIVAAAVAGAVGAQAFGGALGSKVVEAGFGGFAIGSAVGVALVRRHLGRDDELLLRQKRLGFDPEHPFGWWRSKT